MYAILRKHSHNNTLNTVVTNNHVQSKPEDPDVMIFSPLMKLILFGSSCRREIFNLFATNSAFLYTSIWGKKNEFKFFKSFIKSSIKFLAALRFWKT